jgi:hypothetical protein
VPSSLITRKDGSQIIVFKIKIIVEDATVAVCKYFDHAAARDCGRVSDREWRPTAGPKLCADAEQHEGQDKPG